MIKEVSEYLRKKYKGIAIRGYRFLEHGGKSVVLVRTTYEGETVRFVSGDEFLEPKKIGSAERKKLGIKYSPKKRRRKK